MMKKYSIEEILEKAENLSFMPSVISDLMEMVSDIDVNVKEVILTIKKDPGLVARVFKVANSAYYGRAQKANALSDAVVVLGLRGLKTLVIGQAVKHVLTYNNVKELWGHAVKVSLASKVLSKFLHGDTSEDIVVGGLMHDIGKAFIAGVYPETLPFINERIKDERVTSVDAEKSILGFDHTVVGSLITEKWNFPLKFVEMIKYHHSEGDTEIPSIEDQVFLNTIKLGDRITNDCGSAPDFREEDFLEKLRCFPELNNAGEDDLFVFIKEIKTEWGASRNENLL
ncbi:MAG: HDOD domain-containing protein [Candidatus Brocadiaceae bacterium]|nr:HDOD domain-containing protein [Candidatus Brocadiaceae bacterium]